MMAEIHMPWVLYLLGAFSLGITCYIVGKDYGEATLRNQLKLVAKASPNTTVFTFCESKYGKYFV